MKLVFVLVFFSLLFTLPVPAYACEPVMPLVILFGLPIISLAGVVLIKALMFAFLEKSLPRLKAFGLMIAANLFSSLIGLALNLGASVPTLSIVAALLVIIVSILPARRFIQYNPWGLLKSWPPVVLAVVVGVLYFATFLLFYAAMGLLDNSMYALYWPLKFIYIMIALIISIFLTTFWEEWAVVTMAKKDGTVLMAALKANLIAFLIILAFLAAKTLPERIKAEHFLIQLQHPYTQSVMIADK
jgi:hypothetical protein